MNRKLKKIIVVTILLIMAMALVGCTETFDREAKTTFSNLTGGLDRTVSVYAYDGTLIDSWSGKFDVTDSENEVYFDTDEGQRVIIQGGIVINEERMD